MQTTTTTTTNETTTFQPGERVKVLGHGTFEIRKARRIEDAPGMVEDYDLRGSRGGQAMLAKTPSGYWRFMRFGSMRPRMDFVEVVAA